MTMKTVSGLVLSLCCSSVAVASIELPPILGDRMVLQADTEVPVWGRAEPGAKVTVTFRGAAASATADKEGAWRVDLKPMKRDTLEAKGTDLVIAAGAETKTVRDVLVGEVWLGAGQSNMHTPLNEYWNDPETKGLKEGQFPSLRLRKMDEVYGGEKWGWWAATDWRNGAFSAQLFGFGRRLQEHFKCPVGLVEAASNGSPSGPFLSKEGFLASAEIAAMVKRNPDLAKYADKVGWHWRGMIAPCVPYAVKGVYWDQGEGGTEMPEISQPVTMRALVASWRKAWGRDLPWIYVQKPSGGGCALDPIRPYANGAAPVAELPAEVPGSDWNGGQRRDGYEIAKTHGVWLLVNSDLSPGIHPPVKSAYAERGYRIALANVYGEKVEWTGPTFKALRLNGDRLGIVFSHAASGLAVPKGAKLQGFAIAGADGRFVWAEGEIRGNGVVLKVPAGVEPRRVKYAMAWPNAWATLFNAEGFPALGFDVPVGPDFATLTRLAEVLVDGQPAEGRVTVAADGVVSVKGDRPLSRVTLRWDLSTGPETLVLGGEFERTYGDRGWTRRDELAELRGGALAWYALVSDGARTDGYGVAVQPNVFAAWHVEAEGLRLELDCRAGSRPVELGGRTLEACRLVSRKGKPGESAFAAGRAFCRAMCPSPRLPKEPVYGYNDWYCAYGCNTATNFLADAAFVVSLVKDEPVRPFVVVDDGWQRGRQDSPPARAAERWGGVNAKWGLGMDELARRVKAMGARPGLWYRPFLPDDGLPDGGVPADPTDPALAQRIRADLARFADWGMELVKIDFITFDWQETLRPARWSFGGEKAAYDWE